MAYGYFKGLITRTFHDKVLPVKHLILLQIPNTMGIKVELLQWFINFLIKRTSGSSIKNANTLLKK